MTTAEATVLVAALALVGTIISVAGTVYVALNLGKARGEVASVGENLARVETKVDGKMDALLAASIGRAHAEGITTGEQSQRDRASLPEGSEPIPVTIQNSPDAPVPVDDHTKPKP